jgi:hypothetical protein
MIPEEDKVRDRDRVVHQVVTAILNKDKGLHHQTLDSTHPTSA